MAAYAHEEGVYGVVGEEVVDGDQVLLANMVYMTNHLLHINHRPGDVLG